MHNTATILEYETHKLFGDFEMHTGYLISARRPYLVIINKKKEKKELAELWTLLSRLNTERSWKKVNRRISTSTLLGNWRDCGTWKLLLYQLQLVLLVQSSNDCYKDWRTCKREDKWRPSKLLHYWDRPEYWEESWRHAVNQASVKDHWFTLMWRTLKS